VPEEVDSAGADVVALLNRLGISSEEAALEIFEEFRPNDVISPGAATLSAALQSSAQTKS
jgi:hypothetical protein